MIGLSFIIGFVTLIDLARYVSPKPFLIGTTPPQFNQFIIFVFIWASFVIFAFTYLSRNNAWVLSLVIILLLSILCILKSPTLSTQTSIFFRTLANRPTENASALDLRWLGFSYIAFRLIHLLRDKQMGRLPELSLPEFATYVVFFPSLSAGPIDRAERFAGDLRKYFACTQAEMLLAALDLDTSLDGAETTVTVHEGCAVGVDVQLDTIEGGGHIPSLDQETFGTEYVRHYLHEVPASPPSGALVQ